AWPDGVVAGCAGHSPSAPKSGRRALVKHPRVDAGCGDRIFAVQTLGVAAITLVGGAVIGYWIRLGGVPRDRRLGGYGAFVAAFLDAAHCGATLQSLHMQLGQKMFTGETKAEAERFWSEWATAAEAFESTTAKLRLVGSKKTIATSEELEDFIEANVR